MDDHDQPSFSAGRKFGAGFNALVGVAAMLAVLLMANYLSARHYLRVPLSADRNELAPVTRQVLASLTNVVKATVYFSPDEPLYGQVTTLLKEYQHANSKLVIQLVNYRDFPATAERVKAEYKLSTAIKDVIIFECNGRIKVVKQSELSEYDMSRLLAGKGNEIRRNGFRGEQHFTSAIIAVNEAQKLRACFLAMHGEHDPGNASQENGYAKFATMLEENNIAWSTIKLFGTNDVPADCQLLIVAGPRAVMDTVERAKIERYLNQGGRLLMLFQHDSRSDFEKILLQWGVDAQDTLVVDQTNTKGSGPGSYGEYMLVGFYGSHEIVRPIANANLPLILALPRAVRPTAQAAAGADAAQVTVLVSTTPEGVVISDYQRGVKLASRDRPASVPLLVAVEKNALKGETVSRGSTRIVVAGDSVFLANGTFEKAGNREFAWNAVNWLLDRSTLLGIAARPVRAYTFNMSDVQMFDVQWIVLAGVPGAVLLVGVLVWFRRRA